MPSAAALLLALAFAAQDAEAGEPPERSVTAIVYGDDPCPVAQDPEEIVVCARRPDSERYRIPKELRNAGDPLSETAWGARAETLDDAARSNLPGSCSTVGTYGQTGCRQQMLDAWYEERRGRRR
ncbi:MAG: hypothetical protein ACK40O_02340 [Allosphingosinicella sp.]